MKLLNKQTNKQRNTSSSSPQASVQEVCVSTHIYIMRHPTCKYISVSLREVSLPHHSLKHRKLKADHKIEAPLVNEACLE